MDEEIDRGGTVKEIGDINMVYAVVIVDQTKKSIPGNWTDEISDEEMTDAYPSAEYNQSNDGGKLITAMDKIIIGIVLATITLLTTELA